MVTAMLSSYLDHKQLNCILWIMCFDEISRLGNIQVLLFSRNVMKCHHARILHSYDGNSYEMLMASSKETNRQQYFKPLKIEGFLES